MGGHRPGFEQLGCWPLTPPHDLGMAALFGQIWAQCVRLGRLLGAACPVVVSTREPILQISWFGVFPCLLPQGSPLGIGCSGLLPRRMAMPGVVLRAAASRAIAFLNMARILRRLVYACRSLFAYIVDVGPLSDTNLAKPLTYSRIL